LERYEIRGRLDAIVACTSLHHVADLTAALDLVDAVLVPGGVAVIVEWARERFDEATARWCFDRLPRPPLGSSAMAPMVSAPGGCGGR
jgi:SAM-dependent methyltransferase